MLTLARVNNNHIHTLAQQPGKWQWLCIWHQQHPEILRLRVKQSWRVSHSPSRIDSHKKRKKKNSPKTEESAVCDSRLEPQPVASAVVVQVVEQQAPLGAQTRAASQAVQAAGSRAAGHQLVLAQVLQAERWRAALHHQHLDLSAVRTQRQPPLGALHHHRRHLLLLLYLLALLILYIFLIFLSRLLLLLLTPPLMVVNLPQQIVDEDRAPQVGLRVLQEPQLLQGQFQNAAAVLLQDQVLEGCKQRATLASSLVTWHKEFIAKSSLWSGSFVFTFCPDIFIFIFFKLSTCVNVKVAAQVSEVKSSLF